MSRDVLITPASGIIEFRNFSTTRAQVQLDTANNLSISTTGGNVTISSGTPGANLYVGDGINSSDIIFEQNGAVRALAGKTLTLGQANSNISFASNITSGANITGNVTAGNMSVAADITGSRIFSTSNGQGTNYSVGDDAWIGDINQADTISIRGRQNAANAYIVFGNASIAQLGRSGTGPLTYSGAFSAAGNITGGNIITADGTIIRSGRLALTSNASGGFLYQIDNSPLYLGANTANIANASITIAGDTATPGNVLVSSNLAVTGNITGGNIRTAGLISATGNITTAGNVAANFFIGNGSQLTGIAGSGAGGTFQVIARSGSITVVVASGFFSVVTRNSGSRQVAVT
jgi:hypothetical protein